MEREGEIETSIPAEQPTLAIRKDPTIDEFTLIKEIGSGHNSIVWLAYNREDSKNYAIKVVNDATNIENNIRAIINEANILKQLQHPNITALHKVSNEGKYTSSEGQNKKVTYAVLEFAENGALIEFILSTRKLSEETTRYFFIQLIEGLSYLHSKGFAHRDLKPDNLLLDKDYNLLLADFGFTISMAGRDGTGALSTLLGTDNYKSPEIHNGQEYEGSSNDVFAAGIILFVLYTGSSPFNSSRNNDSYYSYIRNNDHQMFWKFHSKVKKDGSFNVFGDDFKNLVNSMLSFDPKKRPTLAQIKDSLWFNGFVPTIQAVKEEIQARRTLIAENEQRRLEEVERTRLQNMERPQRAGGVMFRGVNPIFRSGIELIDRDQENEFDSVNNKDDSINIKLLGQPPIYIVNGANKLNNYYSPFEADMFIKMVYFTAEKLTKKIELDIKEFHIKCNYNGTEETIQILLKFYIREGSTVLEFNKLSGSIFEFNDFVKLMTKELSALEIDVLNTGE